VICSVMSATLLFVFAAVAHVYFHMCVGESIVILKKKPGTCTPVEYSCLPNAFLVFLHTSLVFIFIHGIIYCCRASIKNYFVKYSPVRKEIFKIKDV
jgi:hypothetical protein